MRDLRKWGTTCLVLASMAIVGAGCGSDDEGGGGGAASGGGGDADKQYVLGISNTLVGNGFREEMICAAKAQALASGKISKVVVQNQNGGAPEQIAAIRNLISAGAHTPVGQPAPPAGAQPGSAPAPKSGAL